MPKKSGILGIKLIQNTVVKDYDGIHVTLLEVSSSLKTYLGSGISAGKINGLPEHVYGARILREITTNDVIGLKVLCHWRLRIDAV
jgi:hypothetical protein